MLELCGLTDTLILDEDGLYDCNDFNDRLLLGLKGTLSEAELHFLKALVTEGWLLNMSVTKNTQSMANPNASIFPVSRSMRPLPN